MFGNGDKDVINLSCSSNKYQLVTITDGENKGDSLVNYCQWNQQGYKYPKELVEDLSCQSEYISTKV